MAASTSASAENITCTDCLSTKDEKFWILKKDDNVEFWRLSEYSCRCYHYREGEIYPMLEAMKPEKDRKVMPPPDEFTQDEERPVKEKTQAKQLNKFERWLKQKKGKTKAERAEKLKAEAEEINMIVGSAKVGPVKEDTVNGKNM